MGVPDTTFGRREWCTGPLPAFFTTQNSKNHPNRQKQMPIAHSEFALVFYSVAGSACFRAPRARIARVLREEQHRRRRRGGASGRLELGRHERHGRSASGTGGTRERPQRHARLLRRGVMPTDPTALIDDIEDGNALIAVAGDRNGSWWITSRRNAGGTITSPNGAAPDPERILGMRCESEFGMRMTGQGFTKWGANLDSASSTGASPCRST